MKKYCLAAAPLALLSACSGGTDDGIEPGEWTMTMEVTQMEAADAPGGMPGPDQLPPAQVQTICISPEEAANMDGGLFAPSTNENCSNIDATMRGGNLEFEATCRVPGAGSMEMTMDGTYTRENITADVQMVMAETPVGVMTMTATMVGEHTGECDS